ncbi:MAG: methylmalonyl-CoA epimerase [Planctomycetota bacterium]|nr:methylmalonyl-CoA epimerase [Planctomycetota bacterium]
MAGPENPHEIVARLVQTSGLHHVGIAVESIEESRTFYETILGLVCVGEDEVIEQQVKVAMFQPASQGDAPRIELLEPMNDASPIARHLQRRGSGLHHLAYSVTGIEGHLAKLIEAGVKLIDESPRIGAHGMKIAFLHPKSAGGVLIELCEPQDE